MKCVVLFGGLGLRMKTISSKNKALIEVKGNSIAYYVLKNLEKYFSEVIIITNKEDKNVFRNILKEFSFLSHVIIQKNPTGVPDAIYLAKDLIKEDFAVCLGDFYSIEINKVLKEYSKKPGNYLTLNKVTDPSKYGIYDKGMIVEKPNEFIGDLAVRGFYIYKKEVLDLIPNLKKSKRNETEITDLNNQIKFQTVEINQVYDLGSVDGLEKFKKC